MDSYFIIIIIFFVFVLGMPAVDKIKIKSTQKYKNKQRE